MTYVNHFTSKHSKPKLLFETFNTKLSFVEDICYIHTLQNIQCTCVKSSLGKVKRLAEFYDNFCNIIVKHTNGVSDLNLQNSVIEKVKFFENKK